jgi:hypothetical protein
MLPTAQVASSFGALLETGLGLAGTVCGFDSLSAGTFGHCGPPRFASGHSVSLCRTLGHSAARGCDRLASASSSATATAKSNNLATVRFTEASSPP